MLTPHGVRIVTDGATLSDSDTLNLKERDGSVWRPQAPLTEQSSLIGTIADDGPVIAAVETRR